MIQEKEQETEEYQIEEPPPFPWDQVPLEKWRDWRWQLSNRLNSIESLSQILRLTPEEVEGLSAPGRFRVDITPYFASLINPDDPNCPIRRQVIPTSRELVPFESEMVDSLGEEAMSPVPGIVHRYPDRVLMLVTTQCASYCRFCTRSRIVGETSMQFNKADYQQQIMYIANNPEIRDVLLSGGDVLTLPNKVLDELLSSLRSIPHVEIIRLGSRVPVFLPQRINDELVDILKKYHPLWMNIHFNHPNEITPEVEAALARLANAGIPLGSQTVLMAGINDCPNIMLELVHKLVKNRVRPYYLYQCDLVHGAGHFRTPIAKGIEIMESLRGHTSGYAIPQYVIDAPEGGGKVPILPNYLLSMSTQHVVVRNYEGHISTYTQPADYQEHDPTTCPQCQQKAASTSGQTVAGLLHGNGKTIVPENWHLNHQKHRAQAVEWKVPEFVRKNR